MLRSLLSSPLGALCLLGLLVLGCDARAQSVDGTLLKGKEVTEENLLKALSPETAPAETAEPTGMLRARGIRATIRNSTAENVIKPKKKASALLLITFETNSADLTANAKEQLDVVAATLKNDKLRDFAFEVEGHADARGTPSANLTLSQRRSEAARAYLINVHGIADTRLRAVGKGDTEPMNVRDVAAAENRRISITTVAQ